MANAVVDTLRPSLDGLTSLLRSITTDLPTMLVSAANTATGSAANPAVEAGAAVVARRIRISTVATGLAVLGAATLVSWGVSAVNFLLPYLRSSRLRRFNHGGLRKPWAIVTGGSNGIGKSFAQELAAACFNIVLVARDKEKLAVVAREIEREFPGTLTKTLLADAGDPDQTRFLAELDSVVAALPGPVTVLVNNVGRVNARVDEFAKQDDYDIANVIIVNDVFPTLITKRLLPTLEKNQPSLILNVGAFASEVAMPYLASYCGSKAYNKAWSESLYAELRMAGAKGVECQHLLVGMVHSNANRSPVSFVCPDSRKFARAALRVSTRRSVVAPYLPHALYFGFVGCLPRCMSAWLMRRNARELKRMAERPVYVEAP